MIDGSKIIGLGAVMLVAGRILSFTNYHNSSPSVSTAGLTLLLLGGADMAYEKKTSNSEYENLYLENTPSEEVIDEMSGLGLEA
ncbi:hypothetical protein N9M17_00520 [bacterium]|jgi:hypothetical protein|nr:hypothetical protein [Bacteroidota bacterium]MDA8718487.1 hypothetical protein [bacterium]MDB4741102.1 hypothetical protein [Akkermansiaceae bacterium]|tara:strand:- start:155 stop:406 length:252 start_codon:yes stop_codon:yes gene_type:complete